jgi:hypothetical protein
MDTREILVEAHKRGRGWDPKYPNLQNLDPTAVRKMDGDESDAKLLLKSLQESDVNFDVLVRKHYGPDREPKFDGDIGPATRELIELPRCPLPDFPPPPGARFYYEDPDLQAAVESMQAAAAFTGSYWRGCDPQRPDIHSCVIGIDIRQAPSNFLAHQEEILEARRACAAEIGVAVRFVINPQSMEGLQQYQVYKNIPGGVIGMNYFPSSNSCGKIPNGSMDSGYNPSDWKLHANLGTHESEGHGFGFNHPRGGIMNPSIVLVWPLSWKNDPSWNVAERYYGGKPIPGGPGPGPDPDPQPPTGDAVVWQGDLPAGTYQLVRKGGGAPPTKWPPF